MASESIISFQGADRAITGFLALPASSGPHPAVVLLHDVYGLTEHIKGLARRLSLAGYATLAVDLYSRGDGPAPGWPPKREEVSKMGKFPDERTIADVLGAVAAMRSRADVRPGSVAIVGYSFGGRYALFAAGRSKEIAAAVIYYPLIVYPEINEHRPTQPLRSVPTMQCPAIVFYGDKDQMVAREHMDFMEQLLKGHGTRHEFHLYPGLPHGWANDTIKVFDKRAADDSWGKTVAWLGRYVAR